MTSRLTDLSLGTQYRPSTLVYAVLLCIGMIAAGTCIGVVAAFGADRWLHAADYAE